jgi:voltage-gated potassium channel
VRLALAVGAIVFVALVTYLDRDGFTDSQGHSIGLLEAFYYSTVSVTTTGYGDIVPSTDRARLITTLLVTPARILFLIVLVGTTVELLISRQREQFRISAWRKKLMGQTVVCGYGVKGRAAVEALVGQGVERSQIVAIDSRPEALETATADGIAAVHGDASRASVLEGANIAQADTVIVCPHRDDAAALITLTVRQLNADANIVASVREQENAALVKQSGAGSVIVSSGAAGRLLGLAAKRPATVTVL